MLDTNAATVISAGPRAESFRHRMPTVPLDLSEYARVLTGPTSYLAHPLAEQLSAWALDDHIDPTLERTTDLLVDIVPTDIPFVVLAREQLAELVSHREAFVVSSIDGQSTLETIPYTLDLPPGEVLSIICNLCARGIVELDRSQRSTVRDVRDATVASARP